MSSCRHYGTTEYCGCSCHEYNKPCRGDCDIEPGTTKCLCNRCGNARKTKPHKGMKLKPGFKMRTNDNGKAVPSACVQPCTKCNKDIFSGQPLYLRNSNVADGYCESCATEDEWEYHAARPVSTCWKCNKNLNGESFYLKGKDPAIHCAKCAGKEEPSGWDKTSETSFRCRKCNYSISGYNHPINCPGCEKSRYPDPLEVDAPRKSLNLNQRGLMSPAKVIEMWTSDESYTRTKGGEKMSTLSKIKNLAKSKERKLLEKYDVVDDCGELKNLSSETNAVAIVLQKAFEQYKDSIVEDLKKLEAEENKKK